MFKRAFSLIELLVVIAIIAVLAAIAAPLFNQYQYRVTVSTAMNNFQNTTMLSAKNTYQQAGSFPTSVTYNGVSIPNTGTWTSTSGDSRIVNVYYSVSGDGLGAEFGIMFNGLSGMTGYTTPTPGTGPTSTGANTIYLAWRDINKVINFRCGVCNSSGTTNQYPSCGDAPTCTCAALSQGGGTFFTAGTGC